MDTFTATPTAPAPPASTAAVGEDSLRIVLFGRPATGKSSLLGALAEAASTQEDALGGKLLEESAGLAELRRQLYETAGRVTATEVVPYPVRYYPATGPAIDAVLLDCDGRIAGDLLMAEAAIDPAAPEGSLAQEVADADALLLVTDASADASQLDADFIEFGRFLRLMEEARGDRTEVGGLPVYLVLTKCDLLARATDNNLDWKDRIEQRKQEVGDRFREFLASQPGAGKDGRPTGFGRIELAVWATAVKRPVLLGSAARPREPYAVAELFRQAIQSAAAYRASWDRSQSRLTWLVTVSAALVLLFLAMSAAFLFVSYSMSTNYLLAQVQDLQAADQEEIGERMNWRIEALRRRLGRLREVRNDDGFSALPDNMQDWVRQRHEELKDYLEYYEKLLQEAKPTSERSEENLKKLLARLEDKKDLAPLAQFEPTPAGAYRARALRATKEVLAGVATAKVWYSEKADAAVQLQSPPDEKGESTDTWKVWWRDTFNLLRESPPFTPNTPLPDSDSLTYATALQVNEVVVAQSRWQTERGQLQRLLDVCTALGRVGPDSSRVLEIKAEFKLGEATDSLQKLARAFPHYKETFTLEKLPVASHEVVARLARSPYKDVLEAGRSEVLRQLRTRGTGDERKAERWKPVQEWLKGPRELKDWRALAMVYLRLQKESPKDPVDELRAFLGEGQFLIEFSTVVITVPKRLDVDRPGGGWAEWTVWHEGKPEMVFGVVGTPTAEKNATVFVYKWKMGKGEKRIAYKPGDRLEARLPLKGNKRELLWAGARSQRYQFECLLLKPRDVSKGARYHTGFKADDVQLDIEGKLPPIPDLLPEVRLDR